MNKYDTLWQDYCALKAHLKVLSKVVIAGNQQASLQFAIQSEGVIEGCEVERNIKKYFENLDKMKKNLDNATIVE